MITILPKWVVKFEEKIDDLIRDVCNKENINFHFVSDSRNIKDARESIVMTLVNIQEKAEGNVPDKDFQDFKKMEQLTKREVKNGNKNKTKRTKMATSIR